MHQKSAATQSISQPWVPGLLHLKAPCKYWNKSQPTSRELDYAHVRTYFIRIQIDHWLKFPAFLRNHNFIIVNIIIIFSFLVIALLLVSHRDILIDHPSLFPSLLPSQFRTRMLWQKTTTTQKYNSRRSQIFDGAIIIVFSFFSRRGNSTTGHRKLCHKWTNYRLVNVFHSNLTTKQSLMTKLSTQSVSWQIYKWGEKLIDHHFRFLNRNKDF